MRPILTIAILLSFALSCLAQKDYTLHVADSLSKQPVSYALFKLNDTTYYYTDDKGHITLSIDSSITNLTVACIGYENKKITTQQLDKINHIITLNKKVYELPEVHISPDSQPREIPFLSKKRDYYLGIGMSVEMALKFNFPETEAGSSKRILSVKLLAKKLRRVNAIRLHLYTVDSDGLPDRELLFENITENSIKGRTINFDLSKYNIIVTHNSFFVGVECTGYEDDEFNIPYRIGITHDAPEVMTYTRMRRYQNWSPININIPGYDNSANLMISVVFE